MDWTTGEGYSIPIGTHYHMSDPKEVSPVSFTLHLSPFTRQQLYRHLSRLTPVVPCEWFNASTSSSPWPRR